MRLLGTVLIEAKMGLLGTFFIKTNTMRMLGTILMENKHNENVRNYFNRSKEDGMVGNFLLKQTQ